MFDKTAVRGSMAAFLRLGGILILLAFLASQVHAQTLTTLCSFNGSNGLFPYGGLVLNGSTLYGTTSQGGDGGGNIFSIPTSGGNPTSLASFNYNTGQVLYSGLMLNGRHPLWNNQPRGAWCSWHGVQRAGRWWHPQRAGCVQRHQRRQSLGWCDVSWQHALRDHPIRWCQW